MKLFTKLDLERCAAKAIEYFSADRHHNEVRAIQEAVQYTMQGEPPLLEINTVRNFGDKVYATAQDHYREQTCDPRMAVEQALLETLDEQGETE